MKHAYLIIAYNKFEQLKFLTKLLDDPQNDIYIFIDSKVNDETFNQLKDEYDNLLSYSQVFFTPRVNVYWGDYSLIEAEMICFKTASAGEYDYYHLLSGVDLPLVSQKKIHYFFEENRGKIFLTSPSKEVIEGNHVADRIKYKNIFTKYSRRNLNNYQYFCLEVVRKIYVGLQRLLRMDRIKKYDVKLGFASNWVSIDHETVKLLLDKEPFIEKVFNGQLLVDELFIPTVLNQFGYSYKIYRKDKNSSPQKFQGNLRYINWWDGSPYEWTDSKKDLEQLRYAVSSGHFFSRKFDLEKYPKLKEFIIDLQSL